MRAKRPAVVAALLGLLIVLTVAAPASAFEIITESGQHGDFGFPHDDLSQPGARCGYSAPNSSGAAQLVFIKVAPPLIGARDVTAGRDEQNASWQVRIEGKPVNAGTWRTVAHSAPQTRTTFDDASASYAPIKLSIHGTQGNIYRALAVFKWLRNGAVEGKVKVRMEYYAVKWTVGSPDYVFTNACDGSAD